MRPPATHDRASFDPTAGRGLPSSAMTTSSTRPTRIAPATAENIAAAAATLRAGGLVAMPTETVYGLAALATLDSAAASIFAAKGRPSFNPLIAHFADPAAAAREADRAERGAARGGVLAGRSDHCRQGLVVLPDQPAGACGAGHGWAARALSPGRARVARGDGRAARRALREPLGAGQPNAGRTCRRRPRGASGLDSGRWPLPTRVGVDDRRVLRRDRPLAASRRDFARGPGGRVGRGDSRGAEHRAARADGPGQLASHYAPRARLRLDATRHRVEPRPCSTSAASSPKPAGFGWRTRPHAARLVRLGRSRRGGGASSPICARSTPRAPRRSPWRRFRSAA